jgi:hypothetical protein
VSSQAVGSQTPSASVAGIFRGITRMKRSPS